MLRARSNSGMRDSQCDEVIVPEHFGRAECEAFIGYLYTDDLEPLDVEVGVLGLRVSKVRASLCVWW
jgi:hypothetical protein